jgi:hypothetical protein
MKRENYKGFVIEAQSTQHRGDPRWDAMFILEKHDGLGVTVTPFYLHHAYVSERAATKAALAHGRMVLDGGFTA